MQEKSNEDELAGGTVWFLDSHELGRGHNGDAGARAGNRRGHDYADSDLQRCHPAKRIAASQRASGGRRKAGSARGEIAKSGAAGAGFQRGSARIAEKGDGGGGGVRYVEDGG